MIKTPQYQILKFSTSKNNMNIVIMLLAGILGLIIGSFLNVIILRMNTGKGIGGRSMCFSCRKTLRWHELVPVFSFIFQRGKCNHCRSVISWQYPVVELLTGLLFAGVASRFDMVSQPEQVVFWLLFVSGAMVIAVYDMRHKVIPISGLIYLLILIIGYGLFFNNLTWIQLFLGVVLVPSPFFMLWLASQGRWIGFGDIELMVGMGLLLGTLSGFSAVILSFWSACIVVLPVFFFYKLKGRVMNHEVPFGPFLLLGTYLVGVGGLDLFHLIANMVH